MAGIAAFVVIAAGLSAGALRWFAFSSFAHSGAAEFAIVATIPALPPAAIEETLAIPIERQLMSLASLSSISLESRAAGKITAVVSLESGTDADEVRTRMRSIFLPAEDSLREDHSRPELLMTDYPLRLLMIVALTSEDGSMSTLDLSDAVQRMLGDPLGRIQGIQGFVPLSSPSAIHISVDLHRLNSYDLTILDIADALAAYSEANTEAGEQQQSPHVRIRFDSIKELGHISLRIFPDGAPVRLNDVAVSVYGPEPQALQFTHKGIPAAAIALFVKNTVEPNQVIDAVFEKLSEVEKMLPPGVRLNLPYITAPGRTSSVHPAFDRLMERMPSSASWPTDWLLIQVSMSPEKTDALLAETLSRISAYLLSDESASVDSVFAIQGLGLNGHNSRSGLVFAASQRANRGLIAKLMYKPWPTVSPRIFPLIRMP